MKKIVSLFVALLMSATVVATVPATAQASEKSTVVSSPNAVVKEGPSARWGYCSHTIVGYKVNFYDNQGYCGAHVSITSVSGTLPRCMLVVPANADDMAGSVDNATPFSVTFFPDYGCDGSPIRTMAAFTSDPDLLPDNIYDKITSIRYNG